MPGGIGARAATCGTFWERARLTRSGEPARSNDVVMGSPKVSGGRTDRDDGAGNDEDVQTGRSYASQETNKRHQIYGCVRFSRILDPTGKTFSLPNSDLYRLPFGIFAPIKSVTACKKGCYIVCGIDGPVGRFLALSWARRPPLDSRAQSFGDRLEAGPWTTVGQRAKLCQESWRKARRTPCKAHYAPTHFRQKKASA